MAYQIQQGDTLGGLAKKYGTTLQNILQANPNIKNPNLITTGQNLNLPSQLNTQPGLAPGGPVSSTNLTPLTQPSTPISTNPLQQQYQQLQSLSPEAQQFYGVTESPAIIKQREAQLGILARQQALQEQLAKASAPTEQMTALDNLIAEQQRQLNKLTPQELLNTQTGLKDVGITQGQLERTTAQAREPITRAYSDLIFSRSILGKQQEQQVGALQAQQQGLQNQMQLQEAIGKLQPQGLPANLRSKLLEQQLIPKTISPTEKYGSGSVGEYNFYKEQEVAAGRKPLSYNDYQNLDANRKARVAAAANANGLTNYQESTVFNRIVDKYNSSPLIQAADRTPVLKSAIEQIQKNPNDAAAQLSLSYAYIQALDTYQSAVREGELSLVNSIDSKVGKFSNSIQQIQNGQLVRPEIAKQIAENAKAIVDTINKAAASKARGFQSQADVSGVGDQFKKYTGGFAPSYETPISKETNFTIKTPKGELDLSKFEKK